MGSEIFFLGNLFLKATMNQSVLLKMFSFQTCVSFKHLLTQGVKAKGASNREAFILILLIQGERGALIEERGQKEVENGRK